MYINITKSLVWPGSACLVRFDSREQSEGLEWKGFLMLLDKDADGKNRFQITPTKYEI